MIVAQRSLQYARDGQTVRDQEPHFLSCVIAKNRVIHMDAHEHHSISSSLKYIHTFVQLDSLQISHINDDHDRS